MIEFGRSARWYNSFEEEIRFSKEHEFSFMQVWYKEGDILLDRVDEPKEKLIKDKGFPIIFHALLDINDFEEHIPKLLNILNYFSHKELIIHPICHSEEIKNDSIIKLAQKVSFANEILSKHGIMLFLENNSALDPINYTTHELETMFSQNPNIELLLDIAHIDNYEHLKGIVKIKKPKMLHIADKHFDTIHEHLPIGDGELDFRYIFTEVLSDFEGKIIFEVVDKDEKIIKSKRIIEKILEEQG